MGKQLKTTYPSFEDAKNIVQERMIQNRREYKSSYKELGLPAAPDVYYKKKGWTDWGDFLGTSFPSYQEAKRIVQERGILSHNEYNKYYKELGLPAAPNITYRDDGWTNWPSFFGKEVVSHPSYEEAKKLVQEKGIKGRNEYILLYKELGLPASPNMTYKNNGWTNWPDFFGKGVVSFPTFEDAKKLVQEKGIRQKRVYDSLYKKLGLPADPRVFYKDDGWVDWYDFLGNPKKISSRERETRILTKLSINSILLQDDMPLKVLYMYAVEADKRIAKEIEEILGIASFEERLKWVNKLLRSLKESATIKSTTPSESSFDGLLSEGSMVEDSDETPDELLELRTMTDGIEEDPDEYSAIESVIEEFDDVKDTLSEKASTRINTQLENYLHSIVNKELIKEVDGE